MAVGLLLNFLIKVGNSKDVCGRGIYRWVWPVPFGESGKRTKQIATCLLTERDHALHAPPFGLTMGTTTILEALKRPSLLDS